MISMYIRKAEPHEYDAVRQFYYDLIDDMAVLPCHPKWQKGIYPDDSYLKNAVDQGQMRIVLENSSILGAMVVNHGSNDGYTQAEWLTDAATGEVTMIHTLGVAVAHMGKGIGKAMVQEAIRLARESGQKAIRLDVIEGNTPARRLYEGQGFHFICRVKMFYEDTGWCNFDLFEYPLLSD